MTERADKPVSAGRQSGTGRIACQVMLQDRDIQILSDLYNFGCMMRGQIEALYFTSVPRANQRLKQLADQKYITRTALPLPRAMKSATACQAVYMLGTAGIPVVASVTGEGTNSVRDQLRHGTPAFVLHTLEIVEFRLAAIAEIKLRPHLRLTAFLPERLCLHRYDVRDKAASECDSASPWRTEVYRPDAVMIIDGPNGGSAFGIEIDLGHTSSAEFIKKLAIHSRYAKSGLFEKRYGVPKTSTLVCTTTPKRRDNLKTLVERENSKLFWLTTFDEVADSGILGPIWHAPFSAGPTPLIDQLLAIAPKGETS